MESNKKIDKTRGNEKKKKKSLCESVNMVVCVVVH